MGQQQMEGQQNSRCQFDLFARQMRIYQWRSDSNFNAYVARVHFQNAMAAYQEERFNQFLRMQETKQYLQIYKFKDQMQSTPKAGNEQVIIFQKYHSPLSAFRDKLSFQEVLYVFQGLLTGFQQINKVYERIVVDSSCCFVTNDGAIRAWINPNVRTNKPWNGQLGQLIQISVHSDLIFRIIEISQDSGKPSKRSHDFFTELLTCVSNNTLIMIYSELRRWINQYCYRHKIYMAKKININKKQQHKILKQNKGYFRQQRKTETSEHIFDDKVKKPFILSTQQSEAYIPNLNHQSLLLKSKSLQKRSSQMTQSLNFRTPANIFLPRSTHTENTNSNFRPSVSPVTHQRFIQEPVKSPANRDIKVSRQSKLTNQIVFSHNNSQIWSENCNKKSDLFRTKIEEVPSQSSSYQTQNINKQNINKLQQQKINIKLLPPQIKLETKVSQKTKQNIHKKSMQISILKNMPSSQMIQSLQFEKEPRHKTFIHKRQTNSQSSQSNSANFSRAWITTKTITKLISDSDDQHSIKNSIAQSSDYYNDSVYSGVLTQMGRDVAKPHDGRTKTLGASRQL